MIEIDKTMPFVVGFDILEVPPLVQAREAIPVVLKIDLTRESFEQTQALFSHVLENTVVQSLGLFFGDSQAQLQEVT